LRRMMKKPTFLNPYHFFLIFAFCLLPSALKSQTYESPPFLKTDWDWVDSVYRQLSIPERIAQLIMVPAWSNKGPAHEKEIEKLIKDYRIGGIAFFQGGPGRQVELVKRYQSFSKVPLLMGIDAEWGLGMRLDSTMKFPFQMALGAIQNDSLIYAMGREIGHQLKLTGMHMNFAPVLDINNNSSNPVINYRSFGSDKYNVSRKGIAYTQGMQDVGIIATGKHFPGHGDTDTDSHLALPVITHSVKRLNDIELYPFRHAVRSGLGAIMVAHLLVPELDQEESVPTTLSKKVITDLLSKQIGFAGLTVTDALNMKGVADHFPPGEVEVRAFEAGNDLLVYVEDVKLAIDALMKALSEGRITQQQVERSCKRVLAAKSWVIRNAEPLLDSKSVKSKLNTPSAEVIHHELTAASLTVLRNSDHLIPIRHLDSLKIASVSLGRTSRSVFQNRLSEYTKVDTYYLPNEASENQFRSLLKTLKDYDLVVLGLHDLDMRPQKNFGLLPNVISFCGNLMAQNATILTVFGNPYSLGKLKGLKNARGIVLAYQENSLTQDLTGQLLFGGIGATGRLPVDIGHDFHAGEGEDTEGGIRFSYVIPESLGINGEDFKKKIDSICLSGVKAKAYPGCEVLLAKDGKVFFNECYGYYDYTKKQPVQPDAIYDLASVTKVSGPLPLLMRLVEDGKIELDQPFSKYWPDFKNTDKAWLTVREALAHQASLQAWIPFWKETKKDDGSFRWFTFKTEPSKRYPIQVCDSLWIHKTYTDKIFKAIKEAPLRDKREYLYSGLPSYLYPTIIEQMFNRPYEEVLYDDIFRSLGAYTLVYNPLRFYPIERIVPTENDDFFRDEQLRGYVHDEGAAMMGGISGNAGLFSTAIDLAKLHQMYLWKGSFGGKQYIKPETVNEFIRYQYPDEGSRRGLGFDKPLLNNKELEPDQAYPAHSASAESFGHSGYTGTLVWADPESGLLYVFLSNRVYPTRENSKLFDLNIRSNILEETLSVLRE
jgi:beta-N-acetylhexosaminidase